MTDLSEVTVNLSVRSAPDGYVYLKTGGAGWQPLGLPCLHKCKCGDEHVGIIPERERVWGDFRAELETAAMETIRND